MFSPRCDQSVADVTLRRCTGADDLQIGAAVRLLRRAWNSNGEAFHADDSVETVWFQSGNGACVRARHRPVYRRVHSIRASGVAVARHDEHEAMIGNPRVP
jgi:hypothetical protein